MKVALIQPYLFPTITYFQLVSNVDVFILDDTCKYTGDTRLYRTWILGNKQPSAIELDTDEESGEYLHQKIFVNNEQNIISMLNKLTHHYNTAKYFHDVMELLEKILVVPTSKVVHFNAVCLASVLGYLQLENNVKLFSQLAQDQNDDPTSRILEIVKLTNATEMVDLLSNRSYYKDINTIEVKFIQTTDFSYPQFNNKFVYNLSILDYLFFQHPDTFTTIKNKYRTLT